MCATLASAHAHRGVMPGRREPGSPKWSAAGFSPNRVQPHEYGLRGILGLVRILEHSKRGFHSDIIVCCIHIVEVPLRLARVLTLWEGTRVVGHSNRHAASGQWSLLTEFSRRYGRPRLRCNVSHRDALWFEMVRYGKRAMSCAVRSASLIGSWCSFLASVIAVSRVSAGGSAQRTVDVVLIVGSG
jgi:hypothetical protein